MRELLLPHDSPSDSQPRRGLRAINGKSGQRVSLIIRTHTICVHSPGLSSTRHYAPNTNQLLTNYSFITHSLALSLALKTSFNCQIHSRIYAALARACG